MAPATIQKRNANRTDTQQEIEQHEKELKGLLNRVLKEPLNSAFDAFGSRLNALEDKVADLSEKVLLALTQSNEDICNKLVKNQKSLAEEGSRELKAIYEQLAQGARSLGDSMVGTLIDTLGTRLEGLEKKLAKIETDRLALEQAQTERQRNQDVRQHELQEHVFAQLAIARKSLRVMQIMTLSIATLGTTGVVVMVVRSFL